MSDNEIANMLAKHFIARRDVKAEQWQDGGYRPVASPFTRDDLLDHLAGRKTYGHYLLDQESKCKFFAFDIDLNEGNCKLKTKLNPNPPCCAVGHGEWVQQADLAAMPLNIQTGPNDAEWAWFTQNSLLHPARPRDAWRDRAHPGRDWWKLQMRKLSEMLASRIRHSLGIPALVTYTGYKGVHVYGLTGHIPAAEVREAAILVLESFGRFQSVRGDSFYVDTSTDWYESTAKNLTIELFPKQDTVDAGHYGNLMRLPFGRNLKSLSGGQTDPTFLVNQRLAHTQLAPEPNPLAVLESLNPFAGV